MELGKTAGKRVKKCQNKTIRVEEGQKKICKDVYQSLPTQHSRNNCSALGGKSWQSTGSGHCRAVGADGS